MNEYQFNEEREIAAEIRAYLDSIPEFEEWIQEVTNGINETGEIEEGVFDKIDNYLLDHNLPLRQKFRGVNDYDEGSVQLMILIFEGDNGCDEEYDEEEEIVLEFTPEEEKKPNMPAVIDYSYFQGEQKHAINAVKNALNVNEDTAYFLLKETQFNVNEALNKYINDRDKILSKYCIKPEQIHEDLGLRYVGKGDCEVCCSENLDLYALQCGHSFCEDCWRNMIANEVQNHNSYIQCMQEGCKACLLERDVHDHADPETIKTYDSDLASVFVDTNPELRKCPGLNCDKIITINSVKYCLVAECTCGSRVCWLCNETAHDPCSCENKEKWEQIANADKISAEWVSSNTKICPKCKTRIEKNGGCNHMTCWKCHHEFCWICGHEWSSHGGGFYECNRYKPETGKGTNEHVKDDIDRLSHYFERFDNHMRSSEAEIKQRPENLTHLVDMFTHHQTEAVSKEVAQEFAKDLFKVLDRSRHILQWSYPHAYYMKAGSLELKLFEGVQKFCEIHLDNLTDMIENGSGYSMKDVDEESKKLQGSILTLLKHVTRANYGKLN